MTLTNTANTIETILVAPIADPASASCAEHLLRDMALVLRLTRKVKSEILAGPSFDEVVPERVLNRMKSDILAAATTV